MRSRWCDAPDIRRLQNQHPGRIAGNLVPLAEASWAKALEDAVIKGKDVAQHVAAA